MTIIKNCNGCNKSIEDLYYLIVGTRFNWHLECLKCFICNCSLQMQTKCFLSNGKFYCSDDYNKIMNNEMSTSSGTTGMTSIGTNAKNKENFNSDNNSSFTVVKSAETYCQKCKQTINSNDYVIKLNSTEANSNNSKTDNNNNNNNSMNQLNGCIESNSTITTTTTTTPNGSTIKPHLYHLNCFMCFECQIQIPPGQQYAILNEKIYCSRHYFNKLNLDHNNSRSSSLINPTSKQHSDYDLNRIHIKQEEENVTCQQQQQQQQVQHQLVDSRCKTLEIKNSNKLVESMAPQQIRNDDYRLDPSLRLVSTSGTNLQPITNNDTNIIADLNNNFNTHQMNMNEIESNNISNPNNNNNNNQLKPQTDSNGLIITNNNNNNTNTISQLSVLAAGRTCSSVSSSASLSSSSPSSSLSPSQLHSKTTKKTDCSTSLQTKESLKLRSSSMLIRSPSSSSSSSSLVSPSSTNTVMNYSSNNSIMMNILINKKKRVRTSFKHQQLRIMKAHFQINQNPDSKDLKELSERTGLQKRVLQVWFQNSRAKQRKSTPGSSILQVTNSIRQNDKSKQSINSQFNLSDKSNEESLSNHHKSLCLDEMNYVDTNSNNSNNLSTNTSLNEEFDDEFKILEEDIIDYEVDDADYNDNNENTAVLTDHDESANEEDNNESGFVDEFNKNKLDQKKVNYSSELQTNKCTKLKKSKNSKSSSKQKNLNLNYVNYSQQNYDIISQSNQIVSNKQQQHQHHHHQQQQHQFNSNPYMNTITNNTVTTTANVYQDNDDKFKQMSTSFGQQMLIERSTDSQPNNQPTVPGLGFYCYQ